MHDTIRCNLADFKLLTLVKKNVVKLFILRYNQVTCFSILQLVSDVDAFGNGTDDVENFNLEKASQVLLFYDYIYLLRKI